MRSGDVRRGRGGGGLLSILNRWYFLRNIACSVAGITSDANVLTNYLRQAAQRFVRVEACLYDMWGGVLLRLDARGQSPVQSHMHWWGGS